MKPLFALTTAAALAAPTLAQSATVTVSHDDPDGIVTPGQVVTIRLAMSAPGAPGTVAGLAGDLAPTPNVGLAAPAISPLPAGPTVNLGSPAGGAIAGLDIRGPLVAEFASYQWTAPANHLGPVVFALTPAPGHPSVRIYPSPLTPAFVQVSTAYIPATLTVVPAPSSLLLAGSTLAIIHRRRSR